MKPTQAEVIAFLEERAGLCTSSSPVRLGEGGPNRCGACENCLFAAAVVLARRAPPFLTPKEAAAVESLTSREREVFDLIGSGLRLVDIAKKIHRSVKTVEHHRDAVSKKTGCHTILEIARLAERAGPLETTDE